MKKCGWILSLLFCVSVSFATGPSSMSSLITPIAINDEGDVLCKHYFTENWMGAYSVMPAEISLCLVKDGEITLLEEKYQYLPDYENDDKNAYEMIYENKQLFKEGFSTISFSKESVLVRDIYEELVQEGFKSINLEDYGLDPELSVASFSEQWNIDYMNTEQFAVNAKAKPSRIYSGDKEAFNNVHFVYQINNQIWLYHEEKVEHWDDPDYEKSIGFYTFPFEWQDKKLVLEYELTRINSVIFLPEEDREIDQETDEEELVKEK